MSHINSRYRSEEIAPVRREYIDQSEAWKLVTDTQTDTHTDRHTHRQTHTLTDTQTFRNTGQVLSTRALDKSQPSEFFETWQFCKFGNSTRILPYSQVHPLACSKRKKISVVNFLGFGEFCKFGNSTRI